MSNSIRLNLSQEVKTALYVYYVYRLKIQSKRGNVFHFFHQLLRLQFFIIDVKIILLDFLGPQEDNPTW